MPTETSTLIVGASRGLGLGLAAELLGRGRRVIATVRDPARRTGLHDLAEGWGGRLDIEQVDITSSEEVQALRQRLEGRTLDILMVNSGVGEPKAADFEQAFVKVMQTNVLGAMRAIRRLCDLVGEDGAIAVMSSGLGSVANNTAGGWEPYRSSKAALNQSLRSFAAEHREKPWSITAIAPGWVRTDMGGPQAPLDVKISMAGVAEVLVNRLGARGDAYMDYQGQTVPW